MCPATRQHHQVLCLAPKTQVPDRLNYEVTLDAYRGTWCSGITSAPHAEGPGLNPQCVHVQKRQLRTMAHARLDGSEILRAPADVENIPFSAIPGGARFLPSAVAPGNGWLEDAEVSCLGVSRLFSGAFAVKLLGSTSNEAGQRVLSP